MLHRAPGLQPQRVWGSQLVDHRQWSFFSRNDHLRPTATVLLGVPAQCIRSSKMARVEAALWVSDGPLSTRRLMQLATLADLSESRRLIDKLNDAYDRDGTAFRIERVASGYRMLTRPEFSFWLGKLHHRQAELKLTPPAMETLAIVAYRQPTTRAGIESIRRVQCSEMLKQLMDRHLVRIAGEEDSLGRPFLYETTRQFLEIFGLKDLEDLPNADVLRPQRTTTLPLSSSSEEEGEPTIFAA